MINLKRIATALFQVKTGIDDAVNKSLLESAFNKIEQLEAELKAAHESGSAWLEYAQKIESGEYVLIDKSKIERLYLDESKGVFMDDPKTIPIKIHHGKVKSIEYQDTVVLKAGALYVALTTNELGYPEPTFFESQEEAEAMAAKCKAEALESQDE